VNYSPVFQVTRAAGASGGSTTATATQSSTTLLSLQTTPASTDGSARASSLSSLSSSVGGTEAGRSGGGPSASASLTTVTSTLANGTVVTETVVPTRGRGRSLPPGHIAGIAVGAIVAAIEIVICGLFGCRFHRERKRRTGTGTGGRRRRGVEAADIQRDGLVRLGLRPVARDAGSSRKKRVVAGREGVDAGVPKVASSVELEDGNSSNSKNTGVVREAAVIHELAAQQNEEGSIGAGSMSSAGAHGGGAGLAETSPKGRIRPKLSSADVEKEVVIQTTRPADAVQGAGGSRSRHGPTTSQSPGAAAEQEKLRLELQQARLAKQQIEERRQRYRELDRLDEEEAKLAKQQIEARRRRYREMDRMDEEQARVDQNINALRGRLAGQ
jgi:hypothetical protein